MRLFDTHCHLLDPKFDDDRPEVARRMAEAGVRRCVIVTDPRDENPRVEQAFQYALAGEGRYVAVGVHPHNASGWDDEAREVVSKSALRKESVALGEIGLDYHYDLSPRQEQRDAFAEQLDMAYALDKPAILHVREAFGDAMDILGSAQKRGRLGPCVMHCFSGSWETARECLDMGLYISFSGSLTFKNGVKLARTAQEAPLDRLLVETDCPYLSPEPMRGRRNEPANVRFTAAHAALLRGMDAEAFCEAVWQNACRVFRLEP